jgi:predicted Zn finger-like uncharacterized protein
VYTQCPECGTVFRVTATVLRAARGQVRCGVCDATFDALQYLMEEFEADADGNATLPRTAAAESRAGETATHEALGHADEREPADAAAEEEFDEDRDDDGEAAEGLPAEPVDAEAEEALLEASTRFDEPRAPQPADEAFPLEQLDDPIDVIAQPGAGPDPDFPPFESEPRRGDVATGRGTDVEFDVAVDASTDVDAEAAELEVAAERAAAPLDGADEIAVDVFDHRAGRNTPSADEDRALAEIAAAIARGAQPGAGNATADRASTDHDYDDAMADDEAPSIEIDLLDPADAENIVLSEADDGTPAEVQARLLAAADAADIPDSALEFDLPAHEWDRVFVQDSAAAPLRPVLPGVASPGPSVSPETGARAADGADADADFDYEDDDGDLDDDDLRERELVEATPRPSAVAASAEPPEDPLARTDEFPPLRVTLAEEAAAGLADTPDARPRPPGVSPEDFDALVAAAAARAAAEVAARVGATPALVPASAGTVPAPGGRLAADSAVPLEPIRAVGAPDEPVALAIASGIAPALTASPEPALTPPADGRAEDTWFDARRDLAPEGAPIAETPDRIQFDAERFHAIASEGGGRAWWATALLVLGALALTAGLAAQAAHYWRDTLAQHPIFGPPLREVYAQLGLPLEPQWNLAAYDVKQWGATADSTPGTLRVRASVVNRAPRAQPHPLLRVTLLDRFSAKVARREFTPAEYLPGRTPPAALLPAGARVDADLHIADPGSEAVGFELDVCLPQRGVLVCATDQRFAVQ